MSTFIEVTEIREPIGVEQFTNYKSILNVDQIVLIRTVEPRIAKELGYNTVIVTNVDRYCVAESIIEIKEKIWKTLNLNLD